MKLYTKYNKSKKRKKIKNKFLFFKSITWWTNNKLKTAHHSRSTANSLAMIHFAMSSPRQAPYPTQTSPPGPADPLNTLPIYTETRPAGLMPTSLPLRSKQHNFRFCCIKFNTILTTKPNTFR